MESTYTMYVTYTVIVSDDLQTSDATCIKSWPLSTSSSFTSGCLMMGIEKKAHLYGVVDKFMLLSWSYNLQGLVNTTVTRRSFNRELHKIHPLPDGAGIVLVFTDGRLEVVDKELKETSLSDHLSRFQKERKIVSSHITQIENQTVILILQQNIQDKHLFLSRFGIHHGEKEVAFGKTYDVPSRKEKLLHFSTTGHTGTLLWEDGTLEVIDVRSNRYGQLVSTHHIKMEEKEVKMTVAGQSVLTLSKKEKENFLTVWNMFYGIPYDHALVLNNVDISTLIETDKKGESNVLWIFPKAVAVTRMNQTKPTLSSLLSSIKEGKLSTLVSDAAPPMKSSIPLSTQETKNEEFMIAVQTTNQKVDHVLEKSKGQKDTWKPKDKQVFAASSFAMRKTLDDAVEKEDMNVLSWFVDNCPPSVSCHLSGLIQCLLKHEKTQQLDKLIARGLTMVTTDVAQLIRHYTSDRRYSKVTLNRLLAYPYGKSFRDQMVASLPLENTLILLEHLQSQFQTSDDTTGMLPLETTISWLSTTIGAHFSSFVVHTDIHERMEALRHTATHLLKQHETAQTLLGQLEMVQNKHTQLPQQSSQPYTITGFSFDKANFVTDLEPRRNV
ncbi:hypothetical protein PROFUN_03160 [Planoprotostelium fungivorum]|uniref:Uncharacterized protein n=1 Tax=Planoprotostelium fungivorum TaxID=1890364 RepID=A0A2P6NWV9_9EUKA|nr:hypothetical protein PROFUN_03160 [Planoprotostelium fungivorum]